MSKTDDFRLWEQDMAAHDYDGDRVLAAAAARRSERIRWLVAQLILIAVVLAIAFTAGYSIGLSL